MLKVFQGIVSPCRVEVQVFKSRLSRLISVVVHVNKTQVRMVLWSCFHRTAGLPESVVLAKCNTGRGCASVLNTQWSKGKRSSLENSRYKYFNVSARKKLCCTSSCVGVEEYTSLIPENPPRTRQCFSIAYGRDQTKNKFHRITSCEGQFKDQRQKFIEIYI